MSVLVLDNAPLGHEFAFHHKNDYWTHLVASDPKSKTPIRFGAWKHIGETTEESEVLVSDFDEAKYVVSGEMRILDLTSNIEYKATEGSVLWIEKGSKAKILSMKDLVTVYVEPLHGEKTIYPYRAPTTAPQTNGTSPQADSTSIDAVALKKGKSVPNPVLAGKMTQILSNYVESNPKSEAAFKLALQILPGGNTRSVLRYPPFPLVLDSGKDCYVTSVDGKQYVDFVSEYSAGIYGHSHPDIQAAVQDALKGGFNLGGLTQYEAIFGGLIQKRLPSLERIRFCNSGTEANQMAIGVAKFHTKRSQVVVFRDGYHGGTLAFHNEHEPMNIPHDFIVAPYNDIEGTKALLTGDIAAILVEPVLGAGGCIPGDRDFLQFLRDTCTEIGAILIFDEVMSSRLSFHGMQGHHNIIPEMTTLGKYLGGGFGFGSFGGKLEIMERFNPDEAGGQSLTHSGTFNNNIFTMKAGIAGSKLLTEEVFTRMNRLGDVLRDGVNRISRVNGWESKLKATGFGSLVGIHFMGSDLETLLDIFFFHMLEQGLYIGKRGFFSINMMHEESHIQKVLQAVQDFVKGMSM